MKKILFSIAVLLLPLAFQACDDDLPKANWNLHEIENLTATALDASVALTWNVPSEATPMGYYLSWTSASSTAEGGELTLTGADVTQTVVDELENKVAYTFSVQAVYAGGRSGKVSVTATPLSSLVPPTALKVIAGDGRAKLTWTRPTATNAKGYKISLSPGGQVITIDGAGTESYIVAGLENGQTYTVSLQAVYDKGDSEAVTATVTPGAIDPVVGARNYVTVGETLTMSYNEMYFLGEAASVAWDFGDGTTAMGEDVEKTFTTGGEYEISVVVTYTDGATESAFVTVGVIAPAWSASMPAERYVKTSNPVFARDGQTFYLPSSNGVGDLHAFHAADGTLKWSFGIASAITYGGGAAVGPDDVIYQGARNATFYAVKPDGSLKWEYATGATNKNLDCFPAVTEDGTTVYVLDGDNVLHALNTASGTLRWKQALDGTANKAAALAIGSDGTLYAGTRSYIYAFTSSGEKLWETSASVTEIGSFALNGGVLYAAQTGGGGLVAIDAATGQSKWSCPANGDAYAPIVGRDGTVYFVDKGGKSLYAVATDGTLKWTFTTPAALTYCFPVMDSRGIIYFGTAMGTVYAVDSATGEEAWHLESDGAGVNAQIMAGMTVAPDGQLYVAYIGGNLKAIPVFAGPETSTWSCRGGNIHGTCHLE